MQTFLPYPDFAASAAALDDKRLGNQCYNEGCVLLEGGWPNHPASRMWRGYEWALGEYVLACLRELNRRGRYYNWVPNFVDLCRRLDGTANTGNPPWLGDDRVHASHRANLLRKDLSHYSRFGWTEAPSSVYYWPTGD